MYSSENRKRISDENPDLTFGEISRAVGQKVKRRRKRCCSYAGPVHTASLLTFRCSSLGTGAVEGRHNSTNPQLQLTVSFVVVLFIVSSVCCVLLQKPGGTRKGRASGYIIFASEFRKEATQKNPDLSFGEISRFVGEKVLY